jgi:hypothetical protein
MKINRLAFSRKHLNWSEQQWIDVMFLDEAILRLVNSRTVTVNWLRTTSQYKSKFIISTIKHSLLVMVWECSSGKVGKGGRCFLP